jgi:hypothetical protein
MMRSLIPSHFDHVIVCGRRRRNETPTRMHASDARDDTNHDEDDDEDDDVSNEPHSMTSCRDHE